MADKGAQWISREQLESFLREQDRDLRADEARLQLLLDNPRVDDQTKVTLRESQVSKYGAISVLRKIAMWAGDDGVWSDAEEIALANGWVK